MGGQRGDVECSCCAKAVMFVLFYAAFGEEFVASEIGAAMAHAEGPPGKLVKSG